MSDDKTLLETREEIAEAREDYEEAKEERSKGSRELQKAFIENYVSYVSAYEYDNYNELLKAAYKDAGYKWSNGSILARARKTLESQWPEIEVRLRRKLGEASTYAVHTLVWLSQHSKQDAVRLKAATEILNKAGFAEAQKIELSEKPVEDMSASERQAKIKELVARQGLKAVGEE